MYFQCHKMNHRCCVKYFEISIIMSSTDVPSSPSPQIDSPDLTFPFRLFLLLKYSEEQQMEHVISWVQEGKAFKVHDPSEFENELLPQNFKMKKYASFTRQLCAYGFSCVRKGRQTGLCKFLCLAWNGCYDHCKQLTHDVSSYFLFRLSS